MRLEVREQLILLVIIDSKSNIVYDADWQENKPKKSKKKTRKD
jgi:hypothetical protein